MNDWNIQSRAHACEACTQPFADKQPYHTLLYDEHQEHLRRMDVCDVCWKNQFTEGARERKGFVSHWQGVFEVPPVVVDPIQKATAESLLRQLIELNDPHYAPAAYILAVMLERKRLLKVKEQIKRENQRIFVYEQPKTGDVFMIADPDLHLNQLQQVQQDVAQLLEHGLTPPAPATETPAVSPETTVSENQTAAPTAEAEASAETAAEK